MNVGQLKKLLENVPDNVLVVRPSRDHSYSWCRADLHTAMYIDGDYTEDHGEAITPEGEEFGKRVPVLIVD